MTAMELQQWKKNFVEEYLDEIDDMEVLEKIRKYAKRVWPKKTLDLPCVKTKEQILADIEEALDDVKHGRLTSSEDLEKEMKTW